MSQSHSASSVCEAGSFSAARLRSLRGVTVSFMFAEAPGPKERIKKRCFRGTGRVARVGSDGEGDLIGELPCTPLPVISALVCRCDCEGEPIEQLGVGRPSRV